MTPNEAQELKKVDISDIIVQENRKKE